MVKICLDEIEASLRHLKNNKLSNKAHSKHRGRIIRFKAKLKELNYKGKIPRKGYV